MSNLAVTKLLL